jgi:hypothetical protein
VSPEKAVEILKDALENHGAYVDSIELHGAADAATVMEAVRVVVTELEEEESEDQTGGDDFDDEEEDWEDAP